MPVRKKTSKRITIRKKVSVQKKVVDHKRKLRKEIKKINKNGLGVQKPSKVKKGLPNSYPFKSDALDQADAFEHYENTRRQEHDAIRKSKKDLPSGCLENYAAVMVDAVMIEQKVVDSTKVPKEQVAEAERLMEMVGELPKGTSAKGDQDEKSGKRAQLLVLKRILQESEIVIEVLDARDPQGCRSSMVGSYATKEGKPMIVVLSNSDLAFNAEKWRNWASKEYNGVPVILMTQDAISSGDDFDAIFGALKQYEKKTGTVTIGVVGMPGTGAHDLNKTLRNFKSSQLKKFKMLDTYGPVMPASGSDDSGDLASQVLHKGVNLCDLPDKKAALEFIMSKSSMVIGTLDILKAYKIAKFKNFETMLKFIAKKLNLAEAGGKLLLEKAAEVVIDDLMSGKIKYYTECKR